DDFNGDGLWEVALSWHQAGKGIQLLTVPANPATGRWRRSLASSTSLDEQISAGDIDRDGDPDLLLGTRWLRNDRSGGNTNWWDGARAYRVPITVSANGQSRTDAVGEMSINFTQLLAQVGESGAVDVDALRLAEVNAQGAVIAGDVPFQFEQAANFNATNNASGVLTVLLSGNTGASTTRRYHLYFAKTSAGLPDTQVTPRVSVADNVQDQGQASFKVTTADAIYFYHKNGGGFSSLIDLHDNANVDWIGYDQGVAGAGGTYRGIPNLVRPAEGGHFHPGSTTAVTTLVSAGPLKVTLESKVGSQWTTRWEIFPSYARMTVIKAAASYWFLYEGTPGGQLDLNGDLVVRSNGASNTAGGSWAADINAPEWVAVADPGLGHSLFLAHMDDDSAVDSYRPLDGLMTVFGFGRNGNSALMRGAPNTFAMGLLDTVNFATTAQQIAAHTQPLSASVGSGERLSAGNVTWRAQTLSNAGGSPDRNRLADMNGDGRLDAVVGYEAINKAGKLAWYQQPSNVTGLWTEIVIANDVIGPMSLDVKDMDGDGDMDVVVGEHNLNKPASARLLLFENRNGTGRSWTRHVLATGHEHHDGAQLVDIDRNGAQDVISIGWGHNDVLLYTNPSTLCGGGAATPTPRPTSIPTAQPTARPTTGPQNTATPTATDLPPGPCNDTAGNIVGNPSFEQALERWSWYSNGRAAINGNSPGIHCARAAAIEISAQGTNVQLYQTGLPLAPNTPYRLRFAAKSSTGHDVSVHLHQHANGTTNYGLNGVVFDLTSGWQNFEVDFTTTGNANNNSRLRFWLAPYDANGDSYWFDNVTLVRLDQNPATATPTPQPAATATPTVAPAATDTPTAAPAATNTPTPAPAATQPPPPASTATSTPSAGAAGCNATPGNLVVNPSIEATLDAWRWYSDARSSLSLTDEALHCATAALITVNTQGSNVQFYQTGLPVEPNTLYRLHFAAKSNSGHDVSVYLHQHANGTTNYGLNNVVFDLTTQWQEFEVDFTTNARADSNSRLRFWLAPFDANGDSYWFDNITLVRVEQTPATDTPTPEPVDTETPTPEPAATETPTPEPVDTETPTPEPAATETPTPEPVATETPTPEPAATETPT
ncbi:MAG: carbohydrate binding domain-containing protein, partial [Caldilineaceae bacterium]|nr:carbohydrate binding domain-containing protein [Caldilineaceae bacterium]